MKGNTLLHLVCIAIGIIIGAMATRYLPVIAIVSIGAAAIVVALLYGPYSRLRQSFRKQRRANKKLVRKQTTTRKRQARPARAR